GVTTAAGRHPLALALTAALLPAAAASAPATATTEHATSHATARAPPGLPAVAPPREPIPAGTPADRAAAFPELDAHLMHGTSIHSYWALDQLEAWSADEGGTGVGWDAHGWIGTDLDRLWLRSEGERLDGTTASAKVEVLYGR